MITILYFYCSEKAAAALLGEGRGGVLGIFSPTQVHGPGPEAPGQLAAAAVEVDPQDPAAGGLARISGSSVPR